MSNESQHKMLNPMVHFMLYTYKVQYGLILIKFATIMLEWFTAQECSVTKTLNIVLSILWHSMLVLLFKKIRLLFTMHKISSNYVKLTIIILSCITHSSIFVTVCFLFINIYLAFNFRLTKVEERIYSSNWFIHNTVIRWLVIFM